MDSMATPLLIDGQISVAATGIAPKRGFAMFGGGLHVNDVIHADERAGRHLPSVASPRSRSYPCRIRRARESEKHQRRYVPRATASQRSAATDVSRFGPGIPERALGPFLT
jgi:hypothetical protein